MTSPSETSSPDPRPCSPAYEVDGFVFVSGALSIDANGKAVGGRMEALDAAIDRMTERLATAGGRLENVVKLTYFVTDVSLRDEANRQFERILSEPRPARTFWKSATCLTRPRLKSIASRTWPRTGNRPEFVRDAHVEVAVNPRAGAPS